MSPPVISISGPPASGKTRLVRAVAARLGGGPMHHIRFHADDGRPHPALRVMPTEQLGFVSTRCACSSELVFEQVPAEIRRAAAGPCTVVIIETGAEPCFRHAYPYDVKVFILREPATPDVVFRSTSETAGAIQRAMSDTTIFAAEVYGMPDECDPAAGPSPMAARPRRSPALPPGGSLEEFLASELGAELTARCQLQSAYHGIIESDVVVMAASTGNVATGACAARIEQMLQVLRERLGRRTWFGVCDPCDAEDPLGRQCLAHIQSTAEAARYQI